jgi:hypothetical protein
MNLKTTRSIAKYTHIITAVFQLAFIYTPLHDVPNMLTVVQWVSTPLLLISGFWLTTSKHFYR